MKKFYFLFTLLLAISITGINAQVYSDGDVMVTLQPSGTHDTNTCSSTGQLLYMITVSNSFIGDSIIIKDMTYGTVINAAANTTGQNPWNVMLPVYNGFGLVNDDQVFGGFATIGGSINKVIVGPDTVYNIANIYQIPVPNPCQYAYLQGKVYVDYNSDCIFNGTDVPLSGVGVAVSETLNSPLLTSTFYNCGTDGNGVYGVNALHSWMTSITASIPPNYQFIFPSSACSPASITFTTLPQANVDFALQCNSLLDVMCYAGSQGVVRPNIPFMLYPYVSNTGCNSASGLLKLVLDSNVVYNAGLSPHPADMLIGDTLIWNYTNLTSISNGGYWNSFTSGIHLTPDASVLAGSTLCFHVFANVPVGDVDATNNDYTICLPVVNSFDPNFKEVSPKGVGVTGNIPMSTNELTYTIHFQNTGTAPAINISIIDTLDADLLPESLRILGTSHTASPEWLAPGVVKFNFYNIWLPDSNTNLAASNGFIRFSVKLDIPHPAGTVIENNADIYFDNNPAVLTNTVTNTLVNPEGVSEIDKDNLVLTIYPNPVTEQLTLEIPALTEDCLLTLINLNGEELMTQQINESKTQINLSKLAGGVYFLKLISGNAVEVRKVIKN